MTSIRTAAALVLLLSPFSAAADPVSSEARDATLGDGVGASGTPAVGVVSLWQGLSVGMTPEDSSAIIVRVGGVKKVRVIPAGRSDRGKRLSINYESGKIPLGGMGFELQPHFEAGKLQQVSLHSTNVCGAEAVQSYRTLTDGLKVKYPEALFGELQLDKIEVAQANMRSLESGEKQRLSYAFGNQQVVVMLSYFLWTEAPPEYPGAASNLGVSLWRLATSMYDKRKADCAGTGHRRMDVVLLYLTRSAYDAKAKAVIEELEDGREKLVDQL